MGIPVRSSESRESRSAGQPTAGLVTHFAGTDGDFNLLPSRISSPSSEPQMQRMKHGHRNRASQNTDSF